MGHDGTRGGDADRPTLAQRQYQPTAQSELATEIVLAISAALSVEPADLQLPPLYESVDTEALEAVFFGSEPTTRPTQVTGRVEFVYADHLVQIHSDGWIEVFEDADESVA